MERYVDYVYEIGVMKRRRIAGFDHFISQQTSTLASHSHRAAIIGLILADLEGADIAKVALMLVVHESGEVRIGDSQSSGLAGLILNSQMPQPLPRMAEAVASGMVLSYPFPTEGQRLEVGHLDEDRHFEPNRAVDRHSDRLGDEIA